ncbi:NUDIX hydrolase [Candidatus Viridilinea mediisalina]|uniref:Nudix hydrolase domain-containing protein n=1 Tax=Candidatus Viridilinea mediisalina TaxID=2024553 RepID=A0A2A6RNY7_9CHLR|nr:NUDIX domain-containing protein [Candidatus Viridilinea mediisalina]PDW04550.1 hypothetical protein CJ255_03285 [Candidatus Viridilinea mediisalina]
METKHSALALRRARICILLDELAAAAPREDGRPGRLVELEGVQDQEYLLGVVDMVATMGLVRLTSDGLGAWVVSPAAGWALRAWCDLVAAEAPLVADWQGAGVTPGEQLRHPFAKGANFLAALDQRRQEVLPGSLAVREIEAAVGLVAQSRAADEWAFLFTFDQAAGAWQLPGGRREYTDASLEAALLRELREELAVELHMPDDLHLRALPPPFVGMRTSPTYGLRSRTCFYPFLVTLQHELPLVTPHVRWLTMAEVQAGRAADGACVAAEPLLHVLNRSEFDLGAL